MQKNRSQTETGIGKVGKLSFGHGGWRCWKEGLRGENVQIKQYLLWVLVAVVGLRLGLGFGPGGFGAPGLGLGLWFGPVWSP